jgi:DNA repair exonuclease SbcCD ATPase subunit
MQTSLTYVAAAAALCLPVHALPAPSINHHLQEQQLLSFKKLDRAKEQLSAVKAQRPGSSCSQQAAMQQRLQQAEQEVHAAAAAAQQAAQQLQGMVAEKEKVQQELQAIRQQLEGAPMAQQHADLYNKLMVGSTAACCSLLSPWRLTGCSQ